MTVAANQSKFREAERKYKRRNPPAEYDDVIDLLNIQDRDGVEMFEILKPAALFDGSNVSPVHETMQCYKIKYLPGILICPGYLNIKTQADFIRKALFDYPKDPNTTNLHLHYQLPKDQTIFHNATLCNYAAIETKPNSQSSDDSAAQVTPLADCSSKLPSELVPKLRWCSLGYKYNWHTKLYQRPLNEQEVTIIDECLQVISKELIMTLAPHLRICYGLHGAGISTEFDKQEMYNKRRQGMQQQMIMATPSDGIQDTEISYVNGWPVYRASHWQAQAGIINYYQYKDTLTAHVDRSEINMESPLISYSLGCAAVFLVACQVDVTPTALMLRSGDVLLMSGEARRANHGVPRIIEESCPEQLLAEFNVKEPQEQMASNYIRSARINLNLRQVYPIIIS